MHDKSLVPLLPGWREIARHEHPLVTEADCDHAHALVHGFSPMLPHGPEITTGDKALDRALSDRAKGLATNALTNIAIICARSFAAGRNN